MPPRPSRKNSKTVIHRPRWWVCAVAPWIVLLLICSVCAPPGSRFAIHRRRLHTITLDILTSLVFWTSHLWRLARDSGTLSRIAIGTATSIRRLLKFIIVIPSFLWLAFLGLANVVGMRAFWRYFRPMQQFYRAILFLNAVLIQGISAGWARLCKVVMAPYLWTESLGSTAVQGVTAFWRSRKPKQHSRRTDSTSQGTSAHLFPPKAFFLAVVTGSIVVLLISFVSLVYTSANLNAWFWACLNGKWSTPSSVPPQTSVRSAANQIMDS